MTDGYGTSDPNVSGHEGIVGAQEGKPLYNPDGSYCTDIFGEVILDPGVDNVYADSMGNPIIDWYGYKMTSPGPGADIKNKYNYVITNITMGIVIDS